MQSTGLLAGILKCPGNRNSWEVIKELESAPTFSPLYRLILQDSGQSREEKCIHYGAHVVPNRRVVPKMNQLDWADTHSSCWITQPTQRKPTDTSTCQFFLFISSATGQCCAGQAKSLLVIAPARTLGQWGEAGSLPFQSLPRSFLRIVPAEVTQVIPRSHSTHVRVVVDLPSLIHFHNSGFPGIPFQELTCTQILISSGCFLGNLTKQKWIWIDWL